jgi:hypothetical protein
MIGAIQVLRIHLLVLSAKRAPSISDDRSDPGAADPPAGIIT